MATVRIQVRRGTASQWSTTNPVLAAGEMGVETDTNLFKFGNGTSTWTALSYANNSDVAIGEISQDAINNALSLGAGLTKSYNDGTNTIEITVDSDVIALKSYVDEREVWIQNQADSTYIPQEDRGAVNGVASLNAQGKVPTSEIDLTVIASREYAEYLQAQDLFALDAHKNNTTNAHGIADMSLLATDADVLDALNTAKAYTDTTKETIDNSIDSLSTNVYSYADTKKAEAITAAEAYGDSIGATAASFATGEVSTHNALTANVHGIADTTALATKSYADTAASTAETAAISAASTALSTHAADTDSVHGIADTTVLVTLAGTQELTNKTVVDPVITVPQDMPRIMWTGTNKEIMLPAYSGTGVVLATTANVAVAKDEAAVASENYTDAHNNATTSVHGIADTSKLVTKDAQSQTLDGELIISGNLTVNGTTTTVSTANFETADAMIYLGEGNTANTIDLGIVSSFNDGTYQHSGIVRDSSAGTWKFFKGVTDEPTTTVNFAQGSLDDLAVNNITTAGVVFTDGTQTKEGVASRTPIIQKSGSYTLSTLTERDSLIEVSSSSASTITIPEDSTVNYPVGTSIDILQTSTGQVTIAGAQGVTVNATPGLKLRTQWSSVSLFKRAANTWVAMGDLSA
jgi:limonene-1,2-epoxide hydrolase